MSFSTIFIRRPIATSLLMLAMVLLGLLGYRQLPVSALPDIDAPGWVTWLIDKAKYVWPVALAYVLARREIQRRRRHAEGRDS